jgi:hypothetical protein
MHWKRHEKGGDKTMCYARRDQRFEEEVRTLRAEEEARRRHERDVRPAHHEPEKGKSLTQKVKEMVGAAK